MTLPETIPAINRPIYIIGAGGIVSDAHLPAYRIAGYNVQGITDIDLVKAKKLATEFSIPAVFTSVHEMIEQAPVDAVFDVAVPGAAILDVLQQLPVKANVLMQKPMGENLAAAKSITALAASKQMNAAVNFQLRYAPSIIEVKQMVQQGLLGELLDIEVNINVFTPWHLWQFLVAAPRVEILYHSIHYIDLIRHFLGEPHSIYGKTIQHPSMKELASVRSNIIMDYGNMKGAAIRTNHCHDFGLEHQQSYIKFEGTKGVVKVQLGVLKNYPAGVADTYEYNVEQNGTLSGWQSKRVEGSWFPHAFIGSMAQVLLAADGKIKQPDNSTEDCLHTMACVEAAYLASELGGIDPADFF
jgi:predicted dehydrogenase